MKKKNRRIPKFLLWITAVISAIAVFYFKSVVPIILEESRVRAKLKVRETVISCASEQFGKINDFSNDKNIVKIVENDNGNGLEINAEIVNRLAQSICQNTQNQLNLAKNEAISVNLGTMSGIVLLSSLGPEIKISVAPISTACYKYDVKTENVGINNVHCKVMLKIQTEIVLLIPGKPEKQTVDVDVLLTDCIIAGRVPDIACIDKTYDLVA